MVVCCATSCTEDCEPEVDANGKKLVVCEVGITCGVATQRQTQKFTTTGNPVWDRVHCQELTGTLNNYYTDCKYDFKIDPVCASSGGKTDPHDPTWIVASAAAVTTYGSAPMDGVGGAGYGE